MSMPGEPASQGGPGETEEVLTALSASDVLGLLGMTTEDLNGARNDSALFETLRITNELLMVLGDEGVLGTFLLLPKDEQSNFVRWVEPTDARELRQERTQTLVTALKESPLANRTRYRGSE